MMFEPIEDDVLIPCYDLCMLFGSEAFFVSEIQRLIISSNWLFGLFVFFAQWLIFVYIFIAFYLFSLKNKIATHAVIEAAWSAGLALLLVTVLSYLIDRDRPFEAYQEIYLFIPNPLNSSFPSGHTATSIAIAFSIFYARPGIGYLAIVMAICIAIGRIAAGVHYPTDILGGILVGACSFFFVRAMHTALSKPDILASAGKYKHHL